MHRLICIAIAFATSCFAFTAQAAGEFVTDRNDFPRPGGDLGGRGTCTEKIYESDAQESRLDMYGAKTTFTAWGTGMDFATGVSSDNARVRASIKNRVGGASHESGCPRTGSIDIEVSPTSNLTQPERAILTVMFPFPAGPWKLPVTLHPIKVASLKWRANDNLGDCLRENNGDYRSLLVSSIRLVVPRNLKTCGLSLAMQGELTPNEFIDAAPDDLAWTTKSSSLIEREGRESGKGGIRGRFEAGDEIREIWSILPDWPTIRALQPPGSRNINVSVGVFGQLGVGTLSIEVMPSRNLAPERGSTGTQAPAAPRPVVIGGGTGAEQPNLLPVRLFPERPLIRRIGGVGETNVMVSSTFCAGLGNNEAREVAVPDLVWGVSSARAPSPSVRLELRSAASGAGAAPLSSFDSGALNANDAAVTRNNYPNRPARLRVIKASNGDTLAEYGNTGGCFLNKAFPLPAMDPNFLLRVDTANAVAEAAESDNELLF